VSVVAVRMKERSGKGECQQSQLECGELQSSTFFHLASAMSSFISYL